MRDLPGPVLTMGGLHFPVMVDGRSVAMRMSAEALLDYFGANQVGLVEAYQANSHAIDSKAAEKHRVRPDVPVFLTTADFR